ncbi:AraC family transcriptional regulator [Kribbella sp. NPDC055071]
MSDVLAVTGLGGGVAGRLVAGAPWGLRFDGSEGASFHIVLRGSCWLRLDDGSAPIRLTEGDVTLLPHSGPYSVGNEPDSSTIPFGGVPPREGGAVIVGGPGEETVFLCGVYEFGAGLSHPVLSGLPRLVHLPAAHGTGREALDAVVRLLAAEVDGSGPGAQDVKGRLVDVLFVYILRSWQQQRGNDAAGWFGALLDPELGKALRLMHYAPDRRWTVAQLASEAGMSRSAFARRFAVLTGEPPMAYLGRWRMIAAAVLLRDGADPISVVADRVGYDSEFAFARTFRRFHGQPPGRYRINARAVLAPAEKPSTADPAVAQAIRPPLMSRISL